MTTGITKGDSFTKEHAAISQIFKRDGKTLIKRLGVGNMCGRASVGQSMSVNEFMKFRKEHGKDSVCAHCYNKIKAALEK